MCTEICTKCRTNVGAKTIIRIQKDNPEYRGSNSNNFSSGPFIHPYIIKDYCKACYDDYSDRWNYQSCTCRKFHYS